MFELLSFNPGGATRGQRLPSLGFFPRKAIRIARGLLADADEMSLVEVRDNGRTVFTVGCGWTSRPRPQRAPSHLP